MHFSICHHFQRRADKLPGAMILIAQETGESMITKLDQQEKALVSPSLAKLAWRVAIWAMKERVSTCDIAS